MSPERMNVKVGFLRVIMKQRNLDLNQIIVSFILAYVESPQLQHRLRPLLPVQDSRAVQRPQERQGQEHIRVQLRIRAPAEVGIHIVQRGVRGLGHHQHCDQTVPFQHGIPNHQAQSHQLTPQHHVGTAVCQRI